MLLYDINCPELKKLYDTLLLDRRYVASISKFLNGYQMHVREKASERLFGVLWHDFSYGFAKGLLEVADVTGNKVREPKGYLTADEVYKYIKGETE